MSSDYIFSFTSFRITFTCSLTIFTAAFAFFLLILKLYIKSINPMFIIYVTIIFTSSPFSHNFVNNDVHCGSEI